ncbi:MAG: hypothetical protein ABFR33_06100 [Verrucomicrobiota bacterium]
MLDNLVALETKTDFQQSMERIYAWYNQEIIDRPPVRFHQHNAEFANAGKPDSQWSSVKERWFDAEHQVDHFIRQLEGIQFKAETFPMFMPNLGPEIYSAFYGAELEYGEITAWAIPLIKEWENLPEFKLDSSNDYFRKIEEMTALAIERCEGRYWVGYTDLHPGVDCLAAWRDPQELCMDLVLNPEEVENILPLTIRDFEWVFNHFGRMMKAAGHPSITWMGIPSFERVHIPSCDFSSMISPEHFEHFCLPILLKEVQYAEHNIFHLDGKGVARHIDPILDVPEINAIQWVQGLGDDKPIAQWIPLIQKIQKAGKSVILDIELDELELVMKELDATGIMIWVPAAKEEQDEVVRRLERWVCRN